MSFDRPTGAADGEATTCAVMLLPWKYRVSFRAVLAAVELTIAEFPAVENSKVFTEGNFWFVVDCASNGIVVIGCK